jgi:hypothetical protein
VSDVTRRSRAALRLHGTLAAGLLLCAAASWIEWHRALDGHVIAWVYAFEWPFFAVFGTWMWWRLLHGDDRPRRNLRPERAGRQPARIPQDDPDLLAWQSYLEQLQAQDPPGGPPS